jgi:geranylgeranyl transferase type-2 subunit beta
MCYSLWVISSLGDTEQAHVDRRLVTHALHPLRSGVLLLLRTQERFHTIFGVAGLSFLGYPGLDDLDPVYCMPASLIERLEPKKGWKALPRRKA